MGSVDGMPWDLSIGEDVELASEPGDRSSDAEDVEDQPPKWVLSPADVLDWLLRMVPFSRGVGVRESCDLTPTPFEKATIGSMSSNDVLMIDELIDPEVYVQHLDLHSYHF